MHLVILLYALFASLFTLQKDTLSYCEPFFLVGSRMVFAGLLLLTFMAIKHRSSLSKIRLSHIGGVAMLALSNIYLTNIFEIWAIKHMVSSKACLIYSLSPFVSALVAFVVLRETMSTKKTIGMLVGFLGLLPILFTQTQDEMSTGTFMMFTLAELSIVGAVFCSVYGWIMLKKVMRDYDYSPLVANGLSMILGGIFALGHSYMAGENWAPVPVMQIKPYVINTIVMTIISNIICYNLYGFLLKRFSATFMSFSGLVTPIFASLFGYLWLQEVITWHFFVSIALFTFGLVIFYRQEISEEKVFEMKTATEPA